MEPTNDQYDIAIILPVYNASSWLPDCFRSIACQVKNKLKVELSVFDDGSTDDSLDVIEKWQPVLEAEGFKVLVGGHKEPAPKGVGFAKNQSIKQSTGKFLCFQDSDDMMKPERLNLQYNANLEQPDSIIGSKFERDPPESTVRYTHWANSLTPEQLNYQVLTSHGPTVIMPTWFCSREIFNRVGGFDEKGKGTPEDLIFFYRHLDLKGRIYRVDEVLLVYRYHPDQTTFSIDEKVIWDLRLKRLERQYLEKWTNGFTIWNAGKQGRRLYRSLQEQYRTRVVSFCDVDVRKIQQGNYIYENSELRPKPKVPIVHFTNAKPPFVICVKMDLTKGEFEKNLHSLNLIENVDYVMFS
ncbi:UDP-GlcNAc:betaGal beta-1,3-N-acetylglucosaminyltransferase-like protein 1 [Daphnia pulex]|uniref:UDP-GlcNAc:betaGal beta-1,3-N-acetylglucosaminyltransferase-like protein 1 n=1 Tax=Daphnia pulex TaxID=6669 RepID=UPI001EDF09D9|nr:UDP-GlcNAc:betaGal beta-1,3-N-acetylglucosaminyltransferase-like protein 1 [Daphnia pulex]XP_046445702.1 UDP-GlcNAc:betaGal beta-1,3-N-acetylglucosaminyltransferase-like protein 1 [Daphnia pulex]